MHHVSFSVCILTETSGKGAAGWDPEAPAALRGVPRGAHVAAVRASDGLTGTIRSPVQSSVVRVVMGYEADIEQCVCADFFAGAATAKHPVPGPCSRGTAFVAVL